MLFVSTGYLLFFFIFFVIYWTIPGNRHRKIFILIASYFFYGAWDPRFLILIVFSTLVDYLVAIGIDNSVSMKSRRVPM